MKYIQKFTVSSHDVDKNKCVRPSIMLRYMQEAAFNQHNEYGPTFDQLRRENKGYILARAQLRIYGHLCVNDKIEAETWHCPSKGFIFNRCGRVWRNGELIAELVTVWALVDTTTKRALRAESMEYGFTADQPLEITSPIRVGIPKDAVLSDMGTRTVRYSEIDENIHMNNTYYPDMFVDFMPRCDEHTVTEMTLNFENEAKYGETFNVLHTEIDGVHYMKTLLPNGKNGTLARIIRKNLAF